MRVDAEHIRSLRSARAWSQEELALAAGLNLRTIQRIENQGTASLQSRKALASALDVDLREFDPPPEAPPMRRFEYRTMEIDAGEGFLAGLKSAPLPDLAALFSAEGAQGWRLVQVLTPDLAKEAWSAKRGRLVALLEREVPAA